ncbi:hypothetical protein [Agitococcus lubricus]|uniref:Uncharacterized protein n=1 Tax=Agitococcus lubricus TaxID=1077255 RepID=A0A2T5IRV1_9GAMM|nr:hypothetical protein [Agitococcus lubricus]PTQ86562.1 hypothetical protein C8N29_13812 [Agitococcus lubricus]
MYGVVKDRRYYEQRSQEIAASQIARQKAAAQAEIEHRSKPSRQLDDDEFRAMCGLPPRR